MPWIYASTCLLKILTSPTLFFSVQAVPSLMCSNMSFNICAQEDEDATGLGRAWGTWHNWAGMPWQTVEIYTSHRRNNGWVTPGGAEWVGGATGWCMSAAVGDAETNKRTDESTSVQRNKQRGTWIKLSARVHYFNATWRSLAAIAIALSGKRSRSWSRNWSGAYTPDHPRKGVGLGSPAFDMQHMLPSAPRTAPEVVACKMNA